ncbi:hypothetical protein NSND_61594 [Nitrospira sp. ND1]|nr:hypothetical protein NSND_61594 [Nitrospira sp. ND1]
MNAHLRCIMKASLEQILRTHTVLTVGIGFRGDDSENMAFYPRGSLTFKVAAGLSVRAVAVR